VIYAAEPRSVSFTGAAGLPGRALIYPPKNDRYQGIVASVFVLGLFPLYVLCNIHVYCCAHVLIFFVSFVCAFDVKNAIAYRCSRVGA
jgi:hypothetical protein